MDQLKEGDTRVVHLAHACWGPGSLGLANQRFASPLPLFAIHQVSLRDCGNGNLLGENVSLTLSCPALVFGKYKSNEFLYTYGYICVWTIPFHKIYLSRDFLGIHANAEINRLKCQDILKAVYIFKKL